MVLLLEDALCGYPEEDKGAEWSMLCALAPAASAPPPHPHKDYGKRQEEKEYPSVLLPEQGYEF